MTQKKPFNKHQLSHSSQLSISKPLVVGCEEIGSRFLESEPTTTYTRADACNTFSRTVKQVDMQKKRETNRENRAKQVGNISCTHSVVPTTHKFPQASLVSYVLMRLVCGEAGT